MSFKNALKIFSENRSAKNVVWNLLGGVLAGVIIVIATPIYLKKLGLDGYGILSLWLMMQVMMGLLDLGIGATMIKEFADSSGDKIGRKFKRDLLKTLEIFYWTVSLILFVAFFLSSNWLGSNWIKSTSFTNSYLSSVLKLMSLALAVQFPCALYSSGLTGLQEHGKMNALQISGNFLRHGIGIGMLFWHPDLLYFFSVQIIIASLQTITSRQILWNLIKDEFMPKAEFKIHLFRRIWRFSIGMAITSFSAVLLANADKIALSKMGSTFELGKYSIAFTATGILQLGIQPFYRAFFPRYSELVASGQTNKLHNEYIRSCQIMAAIIIPLGIVGWVFAPYLFEIWIGYIDETIISVFRILIFSITCSGLMWLPAAFQQAHGWTSLHVTMIAGALLIGSPLMVLSILKFGTIGACVVWLVHGVSDFTLGLWLMHKRLLIGQYFNWYRSVIVIPILVSLPIALFSNFIFPFGYNKWINLSWIAITGILILIVIFFFVFSTRKEISNWKKKLFNN